MKLPDKAILETRDLYTCFFLSLVFGRISNMLGRVSHKLLETVPYASSLAVLTLQLLSLEVSQWYSYVLVLTLILSKRLCPALGWS